MNTRLRQLPALVRWSSAGLVVVAVAVALLRPRSEQGRPAPPASTQSVSGQIASQATDTSSAVAALGRLEPAGDVRTLAAPSGSGAMSPRLDQLLVKEGDWVRRGQVLASFDNRPGLLAQRQLLELRLRSLENQVRILEAQIARFRSLSRAAINPANDLDAREIQLSELRGRLSETRAELRKLSTDLSMSQLRSPIDGVVLRIFSHAGERPGNDGILEVGANQRMEAVAEVYESDIGRIRIGQRVLLESESGGFNGTIDARVLRISPQVRQRAVFSTDPSADADARVVEIRLSLDPAQVQRLSRLAGLKVIARFQP